VRLLTLKAVIVASGRTMADVARAVEVKPVFLSQVINGHKPASPGLRGRLAAELDVAQPKLFPELAAGGFRTHRERVAALLGDDDRRWTDRVEGGAPYDPFGPRGGEGVGAAVGAANTGGK
jgi:hypothetical protein